MNYDLKQSELRRLKTVLFAAAKKSHKQLKSARKNLLKTRSQGTYPPERETAYWAAMEAHNETSALFMYIHGLHMTSVETGVHNDNEYTRPTKGFSGIISRFLPKINEGALLIHPTEMRMKRTRSSWILAAAMLLGVALTAFGLSTLLPWTRTSVFSILSDFSLTLAGPVWGSLIALIVVIILMFILARTSDGLPGYQTTSFINNAAMFEEQWFRMGAEKWSIAQRVWSCILFGFVHVANLIYPVSLLIALVGVGGVFMAVYLREYRKSGSVENALMASTKLHATYNRFAFVYIAIAVLVILGDIYFW